MEHVWPLEMFTQGYCFVLVLVDYAKEILTEQDAMFISQTLRNLYKLFGTKLIHTNIYHPQMDGLIKQLINMIRKLG